MKSTYILLLFVPSILISCDSSNKQNTPPKDAVKFGALLPFSGEQAAVGLNMEQAISLAVEDINAAGGIDGRPLFLISRDSNAGSEKGYEQAKSLLYDDEIKYLIGPEENSLGKKLVPDIKTQNVLNILPGFAAPVIKDSGNRGAWIRLAPSPTEIGCAMALQALEDGHKTTSSIVSSDDYQMQLASEFSAFFSRLGGRALGTVSIDSNASNFVDKVRLIANLKADMTLLMAYPATASQLIQEWTAAGTSINWFLTPTLHTEMFLQNIASGVINNDRVFSPSISLSDECIYKYRYVTDETDTEDNDAGESSEPQKVIDHVTCNSNNNSEFSAHYSQYWGKDTPLPASLFYYDAVVLLAFGLARAAADNNFEPNPSELRKYIREIAEQPGESVSWREIKKGFSHIKDGTDIAYRGAAAKYKFDGEAGKRSYGIAQHRIIDLWSVEDNSFVFEKTIAVDCGSRF